MCCCVHNIFETVSTTSLNDVYLLIYFIISKWDHDFVTYRRKRPNGYDSLQFACDTNNSLIYHQFISILKLFSCKILMTNFLSSWISSKHTNPEKRSALGEYK